jgi:hypothetical protein
MDIQFVAPSEIPLPRDEVRILNLKGELYPDGRRVLVAIELTPFLEKPSGDIAFLDRDGNCLAGASFIETVDPRFEMTLHLRHDISEYGGYSVAATIFYPEDVDGDRDKDEIRLPERKIVDEASVRIN